MSSNIYTAQRAKDKWLFTLMEIHAIKRDDNAKKILGLHSGGGWLVLSEDLKAWDELSTAWSAVHEPQGPFPGAKR